MSRSKIALALAVSLLIAVSGLTALSFQLYPGRPNADSSDDTDRRLQAVEHGIEECLSRLDRLGENRPGLAEPFTLPSAETEATDATIPVEDRVISTVETLLVRFDDIERRLETLEDDPLLRGFNYIASANPKLRRRGVRALRKIAAIDPEARAAIRDTLQDADEKVRIEALKALADIKDREALSGLKTLYESGEEDNPFRLARVIRKLGDSGPFAQEVTRLSSIALEDPDEASRYKAIRSLVDHARDETQQVFLQAIHDESSRVRKQAKKGLRADK